MDAAAVDACFDLLLADQPGARAAFAACHAAGLGSGSATQQHLAAAGVLLAIAADFDDFRGLPAALAQFAQGWALTPAAPRPQDCPQDRPQDRAQIRPQDRLRLAAAQVAVPLLDHGVAHDAPQVLAAVAQVCFDYGVPFAAVRTISDRADDQAHVDFPSFVAEVASRYALEIIRHLMPLLSKI